MRILRESYENLTRILQESCKNRTRILQESYVNRTRILQESYVNLTKILRNWRTNVGESFPRVYANTLGTNKQSNQNSIKFFSDFPIFVERKRSFSETEKWYIFPLFWSSAHEQHLMKGGVCVCAEIFPFGRKH